LVILHVVSVLPSSTVCRTRASVSYNKWRHGLAAPYITDAVSPGVLWDQASPPDMVLSQGPKLRFGETWGPPVIARATANGIGTKWSVFVGAGVSPQKDPVQAWGNVFFVLDASTGQILTDSANHTANFSVYDDPGDLTNPNGIAVRPTLYRPGDGSTVDRLYFADTQGKLWKMSLASTDISTWDPNPNRNALLVPDRAKDAFFDPFNLGAIGA